MRQPDDIISTARKKVGESQTAFAKRLGVNQATIHRWEKKGLPKRGMTRIAVESLLAKMDLAEVAQ